MERYCGLLLIETVTGLITRHAYPFSIHLSVKNKTNYIIMTDSYINNSMATYYKLSRPAGVGKPSHLSEVQPRQYPLFEN
jgi:hypothetical protein